MCRVKRTQESNGHLHDTEALGQFSHRWLGCLPSYLFHCVVVVIFLFDTRFLHVALAILEFTV